MQRSEVHVNRRRAQPAARFGAVRLCIAAAAMWFATAGCAADRRGIEQVSSALAARRSADAGMAAGYAAAPAKPGSSAPTPSVDEPTGETPTSLRAYIIHALAHNPELQAAALVARAKGERFAQVTALPDPSVMMKVLPEPVRTAEGDNYFVIGISQKFPIPEKLSLAGRIALEDARMAVEAWHAARLGVIAQVKRAYYQLYVLDKSITITRSNEDLLRSLIEVARVQVAAGRRGQDDVLRAQVELSNLSAELLRLGQRRRTQAARLNELLGREQRVEVPSPPEFGVRDSDQAVEALFARAVDANPKLERLRRRIERDRQAVELARLGYWPDFTVGLEWMPMEPRDAFEPPRNPQTGRRPVSNQMSEDGSDNWAITLGINIPIWSHRIKGRINETQHRLLASRQEYAAQRNQLFYEIEDALARVGAQRDLARLFENTIIPEAEQTYRVSQAGYSSGRTDFQDVIDSWQKWLTFTIQYHRALGDLERSVADLEQAIGLSLSEAGNKP